MKTLFIIFVIYGNIILSQTNKTFLEQLQASTISLSVEDSAVFPEGFKKYYRVVGTGVLFYVKSDSKIIPVIITAKHIFYYPAMNWSPERLNLRFFSDDDKSILQYYGKTVELKSKNITKWIPHPDSSVDLAALPIFDPIYLFGAGSTITYIPYSFLATDKDIYQGADIYVLGYPAAVGYEYHTKALLRKGIVSWVSSEESSKHKILIDCDIFPGNSGGGVFKSPTGLSLEGGPMLGGDFKFIGIVIQMIQNQSNIINIDGSKIVDKSGRGLLSLESIGIGILEPASKVAELLNLVSSLINK